MPLTGVGSRWPLTDLLRTICGLAPVAAHRSAYALGPLLWHSSAACPCPEVRRLPGVVTRAHQGSLGVEAPPACRPGESDVEARRAVVEPVVVLYVYSPTDAPADDDPDDLETAAPAR